MWFAFLIVIWIISKKFTNIFSGIRKTHLQIFKDFTIFYTQGVRDEGENFTSNKIPFKKLRNKKWHHMQLKISHYICIVKFCKGNL
jgi:hypothetical protein